jgi:hypothetical protein
MKTTVEIPDMEFRELLRNTKTRVKREAINTAIAEFNRRRRLERLSAHLGTFRDFITVRELDALRQGTQRR